MSWLDPIKRFFIRERVVVRSLENPSCSLAEPEEWLFDALGATSSSGEHVTPTKALCYGPVYRGVSLIARSVAKIPLFVYRREGEGKDRATDHPAYKLLRRKPNAWTLPYLFKETLQAQSILRGNSYARIVRDRVRVPNELIILNSDRVVPRLDSGSLWYQVGDDKGGTSRVEAADMIHIRGLGNDGVLGISFLQYARDSVGLGLAALRSGGAFYRNGLRPSAVLEHPGRISKPAADRIKSEIYDEHGGADRSQRLFVLEEGMKINPYSVSQSDAQYFETLQFSVRDVANWLGIPPHKLGDSSRAAYNSLEQENQSFLDDSLEPWLVQWEEELSRKLLTEAEQEEDSHVIAFKRTAILRVATGERFNAYASALQNGWMNRDEVRAAEDMNPMPDDEGKKFFAPKAMDVVGDESEEPEEPAGPPPPFPPGGDEGGAPPPEDEDEEDEETGRAVDALRPVLLDAITRAMRGVLDLAKRAAKEGKPIDRAAALARITPILAPVELAASTITPRAVRQGSLSDLVLDHVAKALRCSGATEAGILKGCPAAVILEYLEA